MLTSSNQNTIWFTLDNRAVKYKLPKLPVLIVSDSFMHLFEIIFFPAVQLQYLQQSVKCNRNTSVK